MSRSEERRIFEENKVIYEKAKLKFLGVEGYDVYNCSMIIRENGKNYIFGRVEKREEWANSWVSLFEQVDTDTFRLVEGSKSYQLEDPFISKIHGEYILGGTHVRKEGGKVETFYGYFYRGRDLKDLNYFTTGPYRMKDIRLIELPNGRIGFFSRPRGDEVAKQYGSEAMIGYGEIDCIDDLNSGVIEKAEYINGIFRDGEWGGCNQVYNLEQGYLGIIGHLSEKNKNEGGVTLSTYMNISFIFDPGEHRAFDLKIIGTRSCYPDGPAKLPYLSDCAFTSGAVPAEAGKIHLYSGIGDCEEGRIVIDYPFGTCQMLKDSLFN